MDVEVSRGHGVGSGETRGDLCGEMLGSLWEEGGEGYDGSHDVWRMLGDMGLLEHRGRRGSGMEAAGRSDPGVGQVFLEVGVPCAPCGGWSVLVVSCVFVVRYFVCSSVGSCCCVVGLGGCPFLVCRHGSWGRVVCIGVIGVAPGRLWLLFRWLTVSVVGVPWCCVSVL